jgi:phage tail-like protein
VKGEATYRYLQLERTWPRFVELAGLEVGELGELRLARLPTLAEAVTDPLPPVPGLDGPVGIGVDRSGNLYIADPTTHRIIRVDGCDGSAAPLPCLTGPGSDPGTLNGPRGVLVGPRDTLYIADSGNHRVLLIDIASGQTRDIWGMPRGRPIASDAPGGFIQPWDLAADSHHAIYVADPGHEGPLGWTGGRVQKFDVRGRVDRQFWERMQAQPERPRAPASVAVALLVPGDRNAERLLVLDRQPPRVLVYHLDGTYDVHASAQWAQAVGARSVPTAIASSGGALYVADASRSRVLVFDLSGHFLGATRGAAGAASGLGIDCQGRLLAHPGAGGAVQRSLGTDSHAECGTFLAGPFAAPSDPTRWQRVQIEHDPLPDGARLRLFTLTSKQYDDAAGGRPTLPLDCTGAIANNVVFEETQEPTPIDMWRAAPWNATDILALNAPAQYLWIAGLLLSDGTATATLRQMRLTHDEDGWLPFLPAIYSRTESSRLFLERLLAAFESMLDAEEQLIDDLPRLFDPCGAPDAAPHPSWLEWLSGWIDAMLRETWDDAVRRRVVAEAFAMHGKRGTLESLRRLVALNSGATPIIEELGIDGTWALGASSTLGVDTWLASAAPQGAVLASTALVDRSRLLPDEQYGAAARDDVAHRFAVQIYAAELAGSEDLDRVRQVIDREKPAHTTYHLCAIEPRMRVGRQARVGIDTIVGGPPAAAVMGRPLHLGMDTVLAAGPGRGSERAALGTGARVGVDAALA